MSQERGEERMIKSKDEKRGGLQCILICALHSIQKVHIGKMHISHEYLLTDKRPEHTQASSGPCETEEETGKDRDRIAHITARL